MRRVGNASPTIDRAMISIFHMAADLRFGQRKLYPLERPPMAGAKETVAFSSLGSSFLPGTISSRDRWHWYPLAPREAR